MTTEQFLKRVREYAEERESVRFHESADDMGAMVEDCCDGTADDHATSATEIEKEIVAVFDALRELVIADHNTDAQALAKAWRRARDLVRS